MTTITIDRAVVEQALEALEDVDGPITALLGGLLGSPEQDAPGAKVRTAIANFRAALAQEQAEPLNLSDRAVQKRLAAQWGYVPAEQAEPAQAPVTWVASEDGCVIYDDISMDDVVLRVSGDFETDEQRIRCAKRIADALNAAPPRRTMLPLTEGEILAAVGWERAEMYMKLTPNFPVDEAKKETLKNARAIEKASWEKNNGQA